MPQRRSRSAKASVTIAIALGSAVTLFRRQVVVTHPSVSRAAGWQVD